MPQEQYGPAAKHFRSTLAATATNTKNSLMSTYVAR